MTDIDKDERIRIRAHGIWERQGRPEGRQDEHWDQARREIEMEDEDAAGLQRTLTDSIGLVVGELAEGDRGAVEPELSPTKAAARRGKAARPAKTEIS